MSTAQAALAMFEARGKDVTLRESIIGGATTDKAAQGVELEIDQAKVDGVTIQRSDRRLLVAAVSFTGTPNLTEWFVVDAGMAKAIVEIGRLEQAGEIVAWDLFYRGG